MKLIKYFENFLNVFYMAKKKEKRIDIKIEININKIIIYILLE